MIPEALEKKIIECKQEGLVPFFVCATGKDLKISSK
jgi:hypothetical protein